MGNFLLTRHNWGEPERAPHRRDERSQSIYVYIYYWGEPERDPHDEVYGDFVCLSVCRYIHIPYILVF